MSMDMDEEKKNKYSHQPGPWPQGEPALSASHSAYTNNVPVDIELLRPERAGTALAASQEKRRGLFGFTQHLMLRQGDRNNNLQPQTLKSWWRSSLLLTSTPAAHREAWDRAPSAKPNKEALGCSPHPAKKFMKIPLFQKRGFFSRIFVPFHSLLLLIFVCISMHFYFTWQ